MTGRADLPPLPAVRLYNTDSRLSTPGPGLQGFFIFFKINDEEAGRVTFIYNSYEIRKSFIELEYLCDEMGIRGKRGGHLTAWHIELILTRPIYAGWNLFHGELYKGNHPPIISAKQFNRIQRRIKLQGKITGHPRVNKLYILPE